MSSRMRVPAIPFMLAVLVLLCALTLAIPVAALGISFEISGRVTDAETTDSLPDTEMTLLRWDDGVDDWQYESTTYTDDNGDYSFAGLGSGDYICGAWETNGNYLEQWWDGQPDMESADTIVLSGSDAVADFALEEVPHGTITGRVIDEGYHVGLENITVNAYQYDPAEPDFLNWVGEVYTSDTGDYSVDVPVGKICLEFADYQDRVYISEFYNNTRDWTSAAKITVADGATVPNINATLAEGGHITGKVTAEATGEPLGGVRVVALIPPTGEEESYETYSRVDGTYEMAGLPSGSYVVQFIDIGETDPSYQRVYLDEFYNGVTAIGSATTLAVTAPATKSSINASLRVGASISGKTWDSDSSEPVWLPMWGQGFQVGLYNSVGDEVMWTSTDPSGAYHFGGVPAGTYKVKFYDWGWDEATGDPGNQFYTTQWYNNKATRTAANPITLTAQQSVSNISAGMVSTGTWGSISGTVTGAVTGHPVPGAWITPFVSYDDGVDTWWTESWDMAAAITDASGAYRFDYVPAGTYRLLMAGWMDWESGQAYPALSGYEPAFYASATTLEDASDIGVATGSNVEGVDQVLSREAGALSMQGELLDGLTGTPVPAGVPITIYAYDEEWDYFYEYAFTATDSNGSWSWPVQPGDYKVSFNEQNWWLESVAQSPTYATRWYNGQTTMDMADTVTTNLAGPTVVNGVLPRASHIQGTVLSSAEPVKDAYVCAYTYDGMYWNQMGSAFTNSSGAYDIGALAPGTYRLQVLPPWPNTSRLAAECYPNRPSLDYASDLELDDDTLHMSDIVLEPGVAFRGRALLDSSGANEGQPIKVRAWFRDATEWLEVQSTYAYAEMDGQFWMEPLPAGDYKFSFTDPDTFGGYLPIWYSNKIDASTASVLTPTSGSLSVIAQSMDGAPPVTTSNALGGYKGPATIDLVATDAIVGVASTTYSLDGGSKVSGTHLVVDAVGKHTLTFASLDRLGNEESLNTVKFEIFPPDELKTVPVSGLTRIDTAVEASKLAFEDDSVETVVIATAANWPDALGGAALAGAYEGPILLTKPTDLPTTVADEIDRLGADHAVILGGLSAVSSAVETELEGLLHEDVPRIAGKDRYDTARMVADRTVALLRDYDGKAFVATGGKFPDALGASSLSAAKAWPIYLVDPRYDVPAATKTAMQNAGVTDVVILGGTAVVTPTVERSLKNLVGTKRVVRLAGVDRYDTACIVAQYGIDHAGLVWNGAALATGQNFPDALAGGVLQGRSGSVILLTPSKSLDPKVEAKLSTNKDQIAELRYLGGLNAVSLTVRAAAEAAIQ